MSLEDKFKYIAHLFNSHSGRDAIARTVGYFSLYLSGKTSGKTSANFRSFGEEISNCRLILRLFDDIPMLQYTLKFGFNKQQPTLLLQILSSVKNVIDQVYYPIEHLAWAADHKFINIKSSSLWTAGTILWGLSSYINIVRSIILITILQKKTRGLKNVSLHETIVGEQLEYLICAFKDATDIILAISYLPPGFLLWSGKLDTKRVGMFGTVSSLLRLVLLWRNIKNAS